LRLATAGPRLTRRICAFWVTSSMLSRREVDPAARAGRVDEGGVVADRHVILDPGEVLAEEQRRRQLAAGARPRLVEDRLDVVGHRGRGRNDDLIALLGSAETFMGLGILVPSRNAALLRWGLNHGLRIAQQSTLMTLGLYNEPVGAYLPSILF
jgi:hypothetical protein